MPPWNDLKENYQGWCGLEGWGGGGVLKPVANLLKQVEDCCCVEVLRPSQPNGVMPSAFSLPNHTFTGQA